MRGLCVRVISSDQGKRKRKEMTHHKLQIIFQRAKMKSLWKVRRD
jgi:hypothetical protein